MAIALTSTLEEEWAVIRFFIAKGKKIGEINSEMADIYESVIFILPMCEDNVNTS